MNKHENDVTSSPYAKWLEGMIEGIMEYKPEKIGMCAILPDGGSMTAYFGECAHSDKAMMGYQMNVDAMMDVATANARMILDAAEEQGGDDS